MATDIIQQYAGYSSFGGLKNRFSDTYSSELGWSNCFKILAFSQSWSQMKRLETVFIDAGLKNWPYLCTNDRNHAGDGSKTHVWGYVLYVMMAEHNRLPVLHSETRTAKNCDYSMSEAWRAYMAFETAGAVSVSANIVVVFVH
jgi:hypothetical protein